MKDRPELQVAPPRGCTVQLPPDDSATFLASRATDNATVSLKALADKRLRALESNRPSNQGATDEGETVQLSPSSEGPEVAPVPDPETMGRREWLEWIAALVPLLRDDREYVWARLATLPPQSIERVAKRYVRTWVEAAEAEPKPHRRENAGRRAANMTLLALVQPDSRRHTPGRRGY